MNGVATEPNKQIGNINTENLIMSTLIFFLVWVLMINSFLVESAKKYK